MSRDVCERWAVYSLEARIRARTTPAKIPDSVFPTRERERERERERKREKERKREMRLEENLYRNFITYTASAGDCENGDVLF